MEAVTASIRTTAGSDQRGGRERCQFRNSVQAHSDSGARSLGPIHSRNASKDDSTKWKEFRLVTDALMRLPRIHHLPGSSQATFVHECHESVPQYMVHLLMHEKLANS